MKNEVYFRKVELKDTEILFKWFNDKENVKYMSTIMRCKPHSKESIENEINNFDDNYEHLFMVCANSDEKTIGYAGIDDIDFNDKRAEIFFLIGEIEEKRKGYGKKIVKLLLDYAFNELCLNSLFATATIENKPAISVLEKAGFSRIGIRRQYNYINRKYLDEIFFDITHEDYEISKRNNI